MTNHKNTPEGRVVQSKYADLLSLSRSAPIKPRMTIQNRAKIFSPFAALRGYEDEIASEGKDHLKVQRVELSEEEKAKAKARYEQMDEEEIHRLTRNMIALSSQERPASFCPVLYRRLLRGYFRYS